VFHVVTAIRRANLAAHHRPARIPVAVATFEKVHTHCGSKEVSSRRLDESL
jgi:hypothetical protein